MLTQTIKIKTSSGKWTATEIEYRLFGLLIYKKTLIPPQNEAEHIDYVYGF